MRKLLLFILLSVGTAEAATCPAPDSSTVCPAYNLCVVITHATTDTDGAPMAMRGTEVKIGSLPSVVIPVAQKQYNYLVPKDTTLPISTVNGVTIASNGERSATLSCTTAREVVGQKAKPAQGTLEIITGA